MERLEIQGWGQKPMEHASETNLGMGSETNTRMEPRDGENELQPTGVAQKTTEKGQRKTGEGEEAGQTPE